MLIAQISDPHLRPRGVLYQGLVDSNAMFEAAIRQLGGLTPRPDLVILTGDVADEGTLEEYAVARESLSHLSVPLLVIPGNHDERETFRQSFSDHAYLPTVGPMHFASGRYGAIRVIALDVTLPGLHHGLMDEGAAEWLDRTLALEPSRPTIIMMHQPPFACGIPYVDAYRCREGHRLADVVSRFSNIERIVCGHVHRLMQLRFAGTLLCTAPSTTTAIALQLSENAEPASFIEPPGFLLHNWRPGTGLVTHLVPIGSFPGPMPFA
jgi:3',5'-cyclic-AMP phosphodiesterase